MARAALRQTRFGVMVRYPSGTGLTWFGIGISFLVFSGRGRGSGTSRESRERSSRLCDSLCGHVNTLAREFTWVSHIVAASQLLLLKSGTEAGSVRKCIGTTRPHEHNRWQKRDPGKAGRFRQAAAG